MKSWQAGLVLLFLALVYTGLTTPKPTWSDILGMYVALVFPAAVGRAMKSPRPCALAENGATHCDKLGK
jgi:hypothetical protein